MTKKTKATNQTPKGEITDVHKPTPPFTRAAGGGLEFRVNSGFANRTVQRLTKWESDQKAKVRINVLLGK